MTAATLSEHDVKRILATPTGSLDPDEAREYLNLLEDEEDANRDILIKALTGATGVIHLYIGGKLFILNGLGYLALLAAREFLPKRESYQEFLRDGLLGYTALTVAGYFWKYGTNGFEMITGLSTKLIELGLMKALWSEREAAKRKLKAVVAKAETR